MSFAPIEPHFWDRFCRATERIDLLSRQYDPRVERDLTDLFLSKTRAEWIDLLSNVDACVEPINTFEEMLIDPQVQARGHIEMENGKAVSMASPFVFARTDRSPAPRLGQHTREVLSSIGINDKDQEELFTQGIITESSHYRKGDPP